MSVTLTAGGKMSPAKEALTPGALLDRWHRTLTRMLELALEYGTLDTLTTKRRAWCEQNPFHDLHAERHAAMWMTRMERNELGGKLMDLASELSRLQGQMPVGMVDGLSALLGHPIWPYVGQKWAMKAARLQTTDLFVLARQVMADLRAEDEAMDEQSPRERPASGQREVRDAVEIGGGSVVALPERRAS